MKKNTKEMILDIKHIISTNNDQRMNRYSKQITKQKLDHYKTNKQKQKYYNQKNSKR